jgi:hypothetical protein
VHGVRATALRWVSDEPQPGWVEVEFIDADGRRWLVHDKPPIFAEPPGGFLPTSSYPMPTLMAWTPGRQVADMRAIASRGPNRLASRHLSSVDLAQRTWAVVGG